MSDDEFRTEQRSSVKISQNAKGDPQVEVKAYSHDLETLEETRVAAVNAFKETLKDIGFRTTASVS